jgi:Site-specific DNA methylase
MKELIVDNFAGGGGASTGIELAIGRSVDIAINHDPDAIIMHKTNHPTTKHYCENVWEVNPKEATEGKPVALAWFSPDCKHFSKAKGGKPVDKKIRGLAWIVIKWAGTVRPRVIILENVEEFQTWGPLKKGKPIKSKKGETFIRWKSQLESLGYKIEHRELKACDYGAPTIRKRFFLIARCDGKEIKWPEPTHGEPNTLEVQCGLLEQYKTAADIIDWKIPCKSIFERKKPLADNTMRRVAKGIDKFVINNQEPFILSIGQTGFSDDRTRSIHKPLNTIVTKAEACLVAPTLIQYHTETTKSGVRGQNINEPLMTLDSSPRYALTTAFLTKYYGQGIGQTVSAPLDTIVSKDRFGIVSIKITKLDETKNLGYWNQIRELLNKHCDYNIAYDEILLFDIDGISYFISDIGLRMLEPHELFAAQGFPEGYIIDKDYTGKSYPKTKQVARCGNAVPPPFAKALVEANLPELCNDKLNEVS